MRREAVRDERDRIARELHDVIAHSVSAMVVQVAAVQDLVRTDPARAEEMLARVAETGRRAIGETGRLLHVIRDADDELGLAPTPGLRTRRPGARVRARRASRSSWWSTGCRSRSRRRSTCRRTAWCARALTNALRYAPTGASGSRSPAPTPG